MLTSRIYGIVNKVPTNGSCRKNVRMTGKKSLQNFESSNFSMHELGEFTHPNKFKNPKISTMNPMNGHLKNTSRIPPMKQMVPLIFCLRAKK